jgi:hypothetical protein
MGEIQVVGPPLEEPFRVGLPVGDEQAATD